MTDTSSANSVILKLFASSDNLSAENSKSSADFSIQQFQFLECMPPGQHLPPPRVRKEPKRLVRIGLRLPFARQPQK